MAHRVTDRVRSQSTTIGTGAYTVTAGGVTGFLGMEEALTVNADTGFFFATMGDNWEVFFGTRNSATELARTTIYASTNSNNAVNWGAGVKDIVGSIPARFMELLNTIEIAVADSATPDIGAAQGMRVVCDGTTTITSFGTATHKMRIVRFAGARTLTHNVTSLILLSGASRTTAAGDCGIYASDGSGNWRELSFSRSGDARNLIGIQAFSASGTWTKPAGTTAAFVQVLGGGGGGGGADNATETAGAGGGTGGYSEGWITSGLGATETVTVGAGGTAGADTGGNGGNGGNSSFGAHVTANGGGGGSGDSTGATDLDFSQGGAGASAGTGNLLAVAGNSGDIGIVFRGGVRRGGNGGASHFGGRTNGSTLGNGGTAAANTGAGGGGGAGRADTAGSGGVGGSGLVIVASYR